MINALRGPHSAAVSAHLQPAQFHELLSGYARMHVRGAAEGVAAGEAFVGESFHGDDGYWLTRRLMHQRRHGDRNRGDHYFHSSFADLVLSGLVGLDVTADGSALVVHPLFAPGAVSYFRATRVRIWCREIEVVWDEHGRRYGGARGLSVWVDAELRAQSATLAPLVLPWQTRVRPSLRTEGEGTGDCL